MARKRDKQKIATPVFAGLGCLAALALAAVFGYVLFQQVRGLVNPFRQQQRAVARGTQDVAVVRGSISDGVSCYGAVESLRQASLSFRYARTEVITVTVKTGSQVKAGQLLVQLDKDDLAGNVATAKEALLKAQQTLDDLQASGAENERYQRQLDLTNARAALEKAQRALAEFDAGRDTPPARLERARADLQAARAALAELQSGDRQKQIDNLQYQYNVAEVKHGEMVLIANPSEQDRDKEWLLRNTMLDRALALETAKLRYQTDQRAAERKVTKAERTVRDLERAIAAGSAAAERAKLAAAVESAQAGVQVAENRLQATVAGSPSVEMAKAEATLLKLQGALEDAEAAYAEATLVAPFAGTIASLNTEAGARISGASAVLTVIDTASLKITARIGDIDIARMHAGQPVQVTFESLRNQPPLTGVLGDIPSYGDYQNGLTVFQVPVQIEGRLPANLRVGMTANVFVPFEQRTNVLLVPASAVQYDGQKHYVQLVRGHNVEQRKVTKGISDGSFTEIVEGLSEGDKVRLALQGPNTNLGMGGFPGGPGR